jgi:hypothetical protein
MPTLTLANTFTSGNVLAADDWNDNFYKPTAANSSFEIINGHLDSDNMDASWTEVTREQTQRHIYCSGWSAAGTANLDYFDNWFVKVDTTSGTSSFTDRPVPIPGAGQEFYLPNDSMVIFCWTVMWLSDSKKAADDNHARMHMYVDGVFDGNLRRDVRKVADSGPTVYVDRVIQGMRKLTYWSGHHTAELAAGWHSAGLRLVSASAIRQTRVWARSFRVIAFKKDQTWG